MTIFAIAAFCLLLLVLGFLLPRMSRRVERGGDRTLAVGQRAGGKAPGPLGKLLSKPFSHGRRAAGRSAATGRRGRGKLPL